MAVLRELYGMLMAKPRPTECKVSAIYALLLRQSHLDIYKHSYIYKVSLFCMYKFRANILNIIRWELSWEKYKMVSVEENRVRVAGSGYSRSV